MSATVFLAICILGCDALLYFLFQWTYGEKRRGLVPRIGSRHRTANPQKSQPIEFVPARRKTPTPKYTTYARFQQMEEKGKSAGQNVKLMSALPPLSPKPGVSAIGSHDARQPRQSQR